MKIKTNEHSISRLLSLSDQEEFFNSVDAQLTKESTLQKFREWGSKVGINVVDVVAVEPESFDESEELSFYSITIEA